MVKSWEPDPPCSSGPPVGGWSWVTPAIWGSSHPPPTQRAGLAVKQGHPPAVRLLIDLLIDTVRLSIAFRLYLYYFILLHIYYLLHIQFESRKQRVEDSPKSLFPETNKLPENGLKHG